MTDRTNEPLVAYFSMESGLDLNMPTYAGGLGVLAGGYDLISCRSRNSHGGSTKSRWPGRSTIFASLSISVSRSRSKVERLAKMAKQFRPLQIVFSGKAHPHDQDGKSLIHRIHEFRDALRGNIRVAYFTNYDMTLAKLLCAGVDLWLNTPLPPMEASGTSGMKAAVNGVLSLSVLDGWWIEGQVEDVTGWSIGDRIDACLEPSGGMDA
ncbi:MAG TPA: glycogen/starch/alpha-glucan phosphorylase [Nitrospira sp.]|nr:glycogen/starch/alpha-glucan phosphorylase [Nitrospira sp.]